MQIGIGLIFIAAVLSVLVQARRWIDREIAETAEEPVRDLSDPETRTDLERFLENNQVVGDADIRGGRVLAPVADDRLDPLAIVLLRAGSFGMRLQDRIGNRNAASIYIRNPMTDEFMLLDDLDLDHIIDAGRVLHGLAEKRNRSNA